MKTLTLSFLTLLVILSANAAADSKAVFARSGRAPIPHEYFGMHIHEAVNLGFWPPVPFGAWRLSDASVSWPNLEEKKGEWHFERLDRFVATAQQRKVELLLPLALSPAWASARPQEKSAYKIDGLAAEPGDINDWRRYVRTIAQRYKGRIRHYEIWNEPNVKGLYSGSVDKLVELARAAREELKTVDPSIVVVSPSFVNETGVRLLDEFFAKGGGRYIDVVGFHFYVIGQAPEAILPLANKVHQVMARHGMESKPLWNTEMGWLIEHSQREINPTEVGFPKNSSALSQSEMSGYIARALILCWTAGIDRVHWYAWDNGAMGFAEDQGKRVKPVARVYATVYQWLRDSVVDSCTTSPSNTWVCGLSRGISTQRAWLVWNPKQETQWSISADWGAVGTRTLDGQQMSLTAGKAITVGPTPILVESAPWQAAMKTM